MPRRPRLHYPGAFYHVTLRGNHRQPIFRRPADRHLLNDIVAEQLERFGARVHAYCWMTNHVHLLVQVADAPLGRLMQRIGARYARWFQSLLPTTGHLFERRYHALLVDADAYLLQLIRYIHLNPVRAELAKDAAGYRWSSHCNYLGQRHESWVTTDFALGMFSADAGYARSAYRAFILQRVDAAAGDQLLEGHSDDSRVLGDDRFLSRIDGAASPRRSAESLEDLIERYCQRFAVDPGELASQSKRRRLSQLRALIAHEAVAQKTAGLSAVALRFERDESSLRKSVERYRAAGPALFALDAAESLPNGESPNAPTGTG